MASARIFREWMRFNMAGLSIKQGALPLRAVISASSRLPLKRAKSARVTESSRSAA